MELRQNVQENVDFVILTAAAWSLLHCWSVGPTSPHSQEYLYLLPTPRYGGGPPIKRQVIQSGATTGNLVVELHPLKVWAKVWDSGAEKIIFISRKVCPGEILRLSGED